MFHNFEGLGRNGRVSNSNLKIYEILRSLTDHVDYTSDVVIPHNNTVNYNHCQTITKMAVQVDPVN